MSTLDAQVCSLVQGENLPVFDIDLEAIPEKPTLDMYGFLLDPNAPESATRAVKAIYSLLFWDESDESNTIKIQAALNSKQLLTRWIKERADKGLSVFDNLSEMARRSNTLFQIAYERAGLQFVPDENEEIYESFTELLQEKLGASQSVGEKSELAWAVKELVPRMKSMGLDIAPLIDRRDFYTKFRHFVQSARQRDRLVDAVTRRFDDAKHQVVRKLENTAPGTPEHDNLTKDLVRVIEKERVQKTAHLEDFENVLKDGLTDVLDPSVSVRDIDKKYRMQFGPSLGEAMTGTGYTALLFGRKTILIAEFDYSLLGPVTNAVQSMIQVKGMTDPVLIIKQLREYADELERTMGGG